jgi:hypothetical protein
MVVNRFWHLCKWDPIWLEIFVHYMSINQSSHHSAAEHRASTRILHHTLFFASLLISAKVLFTSLASSSTVLRHVFFGLPLPRLPWGFHSRACLVISSVDFHSVWPSHPHLRFLICKSILGTLHVTSLYKFCLALAWWWLKWPTLAATNGTKTV